MVSPIRRPSTGAGPRLGRKLAGTGGPAAGGARRPRARSAAARRPPHRRRVRARGRASGPRRERRAGGVPVLPHADPGERERDRAGAAGAGAAGGRRAGGGHGPARRGAAGADAQLRGEPCRAAAPRRDGGQGAGGRRRCGRWRSAGQAGAAMTAYYPVCLDLRGRPCVVIGGGSVAARKVEGLLACGARVTVVAPALTPALQALLDAGRIAVRPRPYADGDLAGAALAIAATDERDVNARVAAEARARGVWLNAADDPERCDVILPAVIRRGDLPIAISTCGRSPALARRVREDLERLLPPEYAALLPLLAEVRAELRQEGVDVPPERWQSAVDDYVLDRLRAGDLAGARARLRAGLVLQPLVIPKSRTEA